MNAHILASSAYSGATVPTRTDRGAEYDAFARCTRALASAQSGTGGYAVLARALSDNRRLWNVLAADVSGDGNRLPPALRAGIFYLAEFTRHHSRRVLAGEADLAALIDINTTVMRGLRGQEREE
ncbi:MAG TPA: flagellar biosynthesis regulator FlaF [Albidovulum sp.]|uniref:flagellar biosynthesis regulator FlaF n=1 Tax=Albidovulum sp. TaxID=1872424 RepID=UPI002D17A172|nr:flagellar biosynthesis regulator FlaF [Albidovulum sp.]